MPFIQYETRESLERSPSMYETDEWGRKGDPREAAHDSNYFRHGDNRDEPTPRTTGRSIRYEVTAAPTTLIASLDERTLFLPGWPLEAE